MSVVVVVLGVLALVALCTLIGVIEGRAQQEAYRRLEGVPGEEAVSRRGSPAAHPRR
ncbi:hypothetical protein [Pseudonocardia sp.]|uniref:hypothetical protein n=1 Tax=Pseudonocardia sp. TaxID=60912 RepID=UPI003D0B3CF5